MRYAIFSDIHSNLEALTAVVDVLKANPVDRIICLGDIVGYGPNPKECIEIIKSIDICQAIMGNHDAAVCGKINYSNFNLAAQAAVKINRDLLGPEEISYLKSLKESLNENNIMFVHGSPKDPLNEYVFMVSKFEESMKYTRTKVTFIGHTHHPIIFENTGHGKNRFYNVEKNLAVYNLEKEMKYMINVGSVGQPRDNNAKACIVFYDTKHLALTYRRVDYDMKPTQEKMNSLNLPKQLSARLALGV